MEELKILDREVGSDASFRCGVHDLKFNCLFSSWLWMHHIVSRSSAMLADAAGKHTLYRQPKTITDKPAIRLSGSPIPNTEFENVQFLIQKLALG
jgi:hypothetical protein